MENKQINLLLTSVGRRSYLVKYFKEAIGENGSVHVSNSSSISPAFQYADYSIVSPPIYSKEYISFLLDYCNNNNITAIISLFDIDLPILAKSKEQFEKIGVKVLISEFDFIEICNDKYKTYEFLLSNGFCAPKTYIKLESVLEDIERNKLDFPLIVKPRWGMGSIAVFIAEDIRELEVFYEKARREIAKTYLKYESSLNVDEAIIFQEMLHGQEYGLDIINDDKGNNLSTIVKKKIAMRSGETDCAVTENSEQLTNLGNKLSKLTKHIFNLDVDLFLCDDKAYVLEMNARFGGGYPFSHMAGVNLPKIIVDYLRDQKYDMSLLEYNNGIMSQKDINIVKISEVDNID